MTLRLDHIVIAVRDLDQAIEDYGKLGFTVLRGGEHAGGISHNALVAFADGSYLELIAFKQYAPESRWWQIVANDGEGLVDYALVPDDIAATVAAARAHGVAYADPIDGGRRRMDGEVLRWRIARPPSTDLPFLCGDVTPRDLRVPSGAAAWRHLNGATAIAAVTVAVADLGASLARLVALLGQDLGAAERGMGGMGVDFAAIRLGGTLLSLACPDRSEEPGAQALRHHLATRGEGPIAVAFAAPHATEGPLARNLTHNASLELVRS
jgi:catechol 2,3-dioxygenase-like lactoylglutathione lyase family enzyme